MKLQPQTFHHKMLQIVYSVALDKIVKILIKGLDMTNKNIVIVPIVPHEKCG